MEDKSKSTPSAGTLKSYLHYQYPATTGDIKLNEFCDSISKHEEVKEALRNCIRWIDTRAHNASCPASFRYVGHDSSGVCDCGKDDAITQAEKALR